MVDRARNERNFHHVSLWGIAMFCGNGLDGSIVLIVAFVASNFRGLMARTRITSHLSDIISFWHEDSRL